jgi:hypothetical protein
MLGLLRQAAELAYTTLVYYAAIVCYYVGHQSIGSCPFLKGGAAQATASLECIKKHHRNKLTISHTLCRRHNSRGAHVQPGEAAAAVGSTPLQVQSHALMQCVALCAHSSNRLLQPAMQLSATALSFEPCRAATFADDLRANLKNVAVPGTGAALHAHQAAALQVHLQCKSHVPIMPLSHLHPSCRQTALCTCVACLLSALLAGTQQSSKMSGWRCM